MTDIDLDKLKHTPVPKPRAEARARALAAAMQAFESNAGVTPSEANLHLATSSTVSPDESSRPESKTHRRIYPKDSTAPPVPSAQ